MLVPINEHLSDVSHAHGYTFDSCKKLCEDCGFKFIYGFENELLFYLVERLYYLRRGNKWGSFANFFRIIFNILTAPLPFWVYRRADAVIARITHLPARQAALIFVK